MDSRCRVDALTLWTIALSPCSSTRAESIRSMSSSGQHGNGAHLRTQGPCKVINGLIGGKAKWNSAPSPKYPPPIFNSSSSFSSSKSRNEDRNSGQVSQLRGIMKKHVKRSRQQLLSISLLGFTLSFFVPS